MKYPEKLFHFFSERQEIIAVFLFGSRAEGFARKDSDTDLALLTDGQVADTFLYRLEIAEKLESLLDTEVDLVLLRGAPLLLQFQIFKNGKLIFASLSLTEMQTEGLPIKCIF